MSEEYTDPLIGTVLAERYRILELMSKGGFGRVYRSEHVTIGRALAVKVLTPTSDGLEDGDRRRRFLSEARATSQIRHPNVIDIIDYGHTADGLAYYVMEHLDGEDLAQTLRHDGPLPWSRLGPITVQICSAIAVAHRAGIIHRDLKPANCFRITVEDNPDVIKVLDFGIAKIYAPVLGADAPHTATHVLMGTPAYMSPEAANGTPADVRSDIYALGIVMYELATGTRPFVGPDFMSVLFHHRFTTPEPPRARVADLPAAAERIILRAMSKDPDDRYQSVRALLDDVKAALHARAEPTTPENPEDSDTTARHVQPSVRVTPKVSPTIGVEPGTPQRLEQPTTAARLPRTSALWMIGAGAVLASPLVAWVSFGSFTPPPQPPSHVDPAPVALPALTPTPVPATPLPTPPPVAAEPPPPVKALDAGPTTTDAPAPPVKAPPKSKPAFDGEKARSRLTRLIRAGTQTCWQRFNSTIGYEYEITIQVAASGTPTARATANSSLRRCLLELISPSLSLGATLTGGEFHYVFRRE